MSQRVAKVESLIQQTAASVLPELLEEDAALVTVTRVDAAPDLRNATVWLGLVADEANMTRLWDHIESVRGDIQTAVSLKMTTKYVPKLHFRRDTGGEYAAEIERLLKQI